jgi:hypothetical protein
VPALNVHVALEAISWPTGHLARMLAKADAPVWATLVSPDVAHFIGVLIEPALLFCRVYILRANAPEFTAKAT